MSVHEGCAGGCHNTGPNVSLTLHALPPPGRRPDNVAIGWHSYVGSIDTLDCLAAIVEAHLDASEQPAGGAYPAERRPALARDLSTPLLRPAALLTKRQR